MTTFSQYNYLRITNDTCGNRTHNMLENVKEITNYNPPARLTRGPLADGVRFVQVLCISNVK